MHPKIQIRIANTLGTIGYTIGYENNIENNGNMKKINETYPGNPKS